MGVVELLELAQGVEQVPLIPDLDAAEHHLDPRIRQDGIEQAGELSVPVPDHVTRSATHVLKIRDEVRRAARCPRP
jgi:hypothetical protein